MQIMATTYLYFLIYRVSQKTAGGFLNILQNNANLLKTTKCNNESAMLAAKSVHSSAVNTTTATFEIFNLFIVSQMSLKTYSAYF